MKNNFLKYKNLVLLWLTQALSALGSSMTGFGLVIVLYRQSGSALASAMLTVCSYAPYVLMSIFAGAFADRWNKKAVMLVSDTLAAFTTVCVLILLKSGNLEPWHLYVINAVNGLMNTIGQPAADVAVTLVTPKDFYGKASAMRSFSNSLNTILTPALAAFIMSFWGIEAVITIDLITFAAAFISLMFFIRIPQEEKKQGSGDSVFASAKAGLDFLKQNKGILGLIMYLSAINLVASIYEAAIAPMILSRENAGETALGAVNACVGIASLIGSVIAGVLPEPKNRVKTINLCLFISMSTENFFLAFGRSPVMWCIGAVLGWIVIPMMNANLDVIMRSKIPVETQGRVFSVRNTLQFFTIPVGYFLGGLMVDNVFEPFMAAMPPESLLVSIFGSGKGSGAALLFAVIGAAGVIVCLIFSRNKDINALEKDG
ncbi:MAG: MFS transporter [Ruminococcus sp.]|nr:MFS transporter [Ruminococcus sp.]